MRDRPILAGDRGQLVVVVALVLATSLVALALVLNSGIYAENLSTRETSGSAEVTLAVQDAYDEAAVAMRSANRAGESTPGEAVNSFEADLEHVSGVVTRDRALRGEAFDVDLRGTTSGYSLQQDASRDFTNAADGGNWTLAENVDRMAGGRVIVDKGTLANEPDDEDALVNETFGLVLDDGGAEWRIHVVHDDAGEVAVAGGEADELGELFDNGNLEVDDGCTVDADSAVLDLAEGRVNGTTCPGLAFADNLASELTVSYANGESAEGTYRMLVTEDANVVGDFNAQDPDPYRAGAVFDATVAMTYEQSDVRYAGERIVFAEPLVYEADD